MSLPPIPGMSPQLPAHIGKTFTLKAIVGDQRLGDPVLITVDESTVRPFALFRAICERFELPTCYTFDRVFRRLVKRGTRLVCVLRWRSWERGQPA